MRRTARSGCRCATSTTPRCQTKYQTCQSKGQKPRRRWRRQPPPRRRRRKSRRSNSAAERALLARCSRCPATTPKKRRTEPEKKLEKVGKSWEHASGLVSVRKHDTRRDSSARNQGNSPSEHSGAVAFWSRQGVKNGACRDSLQRLRFRHLGGDSGHSELT